MGGLSSKSGFLLICCIFQYAEGAGKGDCGPPRKVEFAEHHADGYVIGTRVRYECDNKGYRREAGKSNLMTCEDLAGHPKWTYKHPPSCIRLSPMATWENSSIGPQITTQRVMQGFCGIPIPYKYTTVKVIRYKVGQKLQYKCLDGYQAQTPIEEISTCENSSGKEIWSPLTLQCTNDSSFTSGKQDPKAGCLTGRETPCEEAGGKLCQLDPNAALFFMVMATMCFIL